MLLGLVTYFEAAANCTSIGATLAAIYNADELAQARAAISAAGVTKAITAAVSDGSGWAWHGTDRWVEGGFPLSTGQVTDQREGHGVWMYSLHRSEDDFVWDADGMMERHPALCRRGAPSPPTPTLPPPTIQDLADGLAALRASYSILSTTVSEHTAALSCDAEGSRRMEASEAVGQMPFAHAPSDRNFLAKRNVVSDYLNQNPSLAAKMKVDELTDHLQRIVQHFGQPARE